MVGTASWHPSVVRLLCINCPRFCRFFHVAAVQAFTISFAQLHRRLTAGCVRQLLRYSSVYVCTGSSYLACVWLFEIASRLSKRCLASVNTCVPVSLHSWPDWSFVLVASCCCRSIDLCPRSAPNMVLPVRQSVSMPMFTLLLIHQKLIWSSFNTFRLIITLRKTYSS